MDANKKPSKMFRDAKLKRPILPVFITELYIYNFVLDLISFAYNHLFVIAESFVAPLHISSQFVSEDDQ